MSIRALPSERRCICTHQLAQHHVGIRCDICDCEIYAAKPTWIIVPTSSRCGGRWAWMRIKPSGTWQMQGCVCHHPWTLAMRAAHSRRHPRGTK